MALQLGLTLAGTFDSQFDPDAIAFLGAAGLTDAATCYAINDLVTGLKLNGLWTKMSAIYPFAGSTATTQKWNLKDPRDLNAAFRLTFFGGWTHASAGATPNGTNGYANTFLTPSSTLSVNSTHLSTYLNSNNAPPFADPIEIGSFNQITQAILIQQAIAATLTTRNLGSVVSGAQSGRTGFGITSKTSSTVTTLYKDGVFVASGNSGGTLPNLSVYIGTMNYLGTPFSTGWTNNTIAFSSIGAGLTAAESLTFTSIVQRYQNALSRAAVAVPTVQDLDAQNFLVAAGTTDTAQANAIQNLVAGLKFNSLWTKMQAIYPFIGSTSTTQKFNLKSPYDTNAAFRLTFSGGWTHSAFGALPNGTNGFANTFYIPNTSGSQNDAHASLYLRTNTAVNAKDFGASQGSPTRQTYIGARDASNAQAWGLNSGSVDVGSQTDARGLWLVTRSDATNVLGYRNAILLNTNALASSGQNTVAYYISAFNNNGTAQQFSNRQVAFGSIGTGLSSTDITNLYNVVLNYQTQAGRIAATVTVGNSMSQYSPNATTWTTGTSVPAVDFRGIAWSPTLNLWVAIGISTTVGVSFDGITWSTTTCSNNSTWDRVLWASGMSLFVATGAVPSAASNAVMTSANGTTWTNRTGTSTNNWRGMAYSPSLNRIVSVSSNGTTSTAVQTSDNGTSWTTRTTPSGGAWWGVAWSPALTLFCAVKFGSTDIMTSPDGITWTARTGANANNWIDIAWSPNLGIFAAVSNNGTLNRVQTSPDGITWTLRTTPASAEVSWNTMVWSNSLQLFVAVAANATSSLQVMTSPDGITWTSRTTTTTGLVGVGAQ
jgi:hypothetical protein